MNPNRPLLLLPATSLAHLLRRDVLQIDRQDVRIVFRISHDLCGIERQDGFRNDGRGFVEEVGVVDPEGLVVPIDFPRDERLGDESLGEDDTFDFSLLLILLRESRLFVTAMGRREYVSTTTLLVFFG